MEKLFENAQKRHKQLQELIDNLKNMPIAPSVDAAKMAEFRRAVQMFLSTLDAESMQNEIMTVATVYPVYQAGKTYKSKDVFSYGTNAVDDPQLYMVLQPHTAQEDWKPDETPALYKKIGVTENGTPIWVQPICAMDAYDIGNVVFHKDAFWENEFEKNTNEPGIFGWKKL